MGFDVPVVHSQRMSRDDFPFACISLRSSRLHDHNVFPARQLETLKCTFSFSMMIINIQTATNLTYGE